MINAGGKKSELPKLNYNNRVIHTPNNIVSAFSEHFASVATILDRDIPVHNKSPLDYLGNACDNSLFATPCTRDEVVTLIASFPTKGCCSTRVPIFIYKKLIHLLSPVISNLFNESVNSGLFPDCLKIARVVPIYKSEDRSDISNYRPVSTLLVLAKVFEKLMHKRLLTFLSNNNIIYKNQFGFQVGYNTSDAILEFLDFVYTTLYNKLYLMPVYLDFSKAFDTVNHNILYSKLHHYGIRGVVLDWFRSYLTNRINSMCIQGIDSAESDINMGVPQGSIVGQTLFLLYINDMMNSAPDLSFVHFADDTTIVAADNSKDTLFVTVNTSLSAIDDTTIEAADNSEDALFVTVTRNLSAIDAWLSVNRLIS